jgi:hypothetical protein
MISDNQAIVGIGVINRAAVNAFKSDARQRNIEKQRAVYMGEKDITNVLTAAQEKDRDEGKPFKADLELAGDHAEKSLSFGVGQRLTGAYSCYKADMELECIRHILSALCSICHALNWQKAEAYLNEQSRVLYKLNKEI